ncbi:MAG TPA: nodulation protein NfeD [Capillibacterium sp.]
MKTQSFYELVESGVQVMMGKKFVKISPFTIILLVIAIVITIASYRKAGHDETDLLYVIPLKGNISGGMADFIKRAVAEAEERQAEGIILELKTLGGYADSMTEIGDVISKAKVPVDVFIEGRALSAGAYIALCGNRIVMSPDAVIGASQPLVTDGSPAPEKTIAAFRKMFRAVAEARAEKRGLDLNPLLAEAMVDPSVEVEGVIAKGELLALTAQEALTHQYADLIADNLNEAILKLGYEGLTVVTVKQTPVESMVRFLTDPVISPLLLTIGFTALIIEVFTAGFGVAGIVGIIALLLFFGARMFSGLAGMEVIFLFFLGIVLLVLEAFFLPGFGFAGVLGLISIAGSIILSHASSGQGIASLLISLTWSVFLVSLIFQYLKGSSLWNRLVLKESAVKEEGYSAVPTHDQYIGQVGVVVHPLRPSGVIEMTDGQRLDVVSEGSYIPRGQRVKVIAVEGRRILVRLEG